MTVDTRMKKSNLKSGSGPKTEGYVISEAALFCGLSVHQIQTYLDMRLLYACGTTRGGFRLFDDDCLQRLMLISACREVGLGLPEIFEFVRALDNDDKQQCQTVEWQIRNAESTE